MGVQDRLTQLWSSLAGAPRPELDTGSNQPTRPNRGLDPTDAEVDEDAFRLGWLSSPQLRVYGFHVAFDSELGPTIRVSEDGARPASLDGDRSPPEKPLAGEAAASAEALAQALGAAFDRSVRPEFVLAVRGGHCSDGSDPESVRAAEASRRSAQLIEAMIANDASRFESVLAQAASEAATPGGTAHLAQVSVGVHCTDEDPEEQPDHAARFVGGRRGLASVALAPLAVAAKMGRADYIKALLPLSACDSHLLFDKKRGVVEVDYGSVAITPETQMCDFDHGSALLAAAIAGHADCVKLLWEPHTSHDAFNAAEVLTAAMHSGSRETIDAVLAFTPPAARDWLGRDAFANAVGVGNFALAEEFRPTADLNAGEGYALRAACEWHATRSAREDDHRALALAESIVDGVDRAHIAAIADTIAERREKSDPLFTFDTEEERALKLVALSRRDETMDLLASKSVVAAARTGRVEALAQGWEAEKATDSFLEADALSAAIRHRSARGDRGTLDAVLERASPSATDRFGRDGLTNALRLDAVDVAHELMKRPDVNAAGEAALQTACLKHERAWNDDADTPFLKIARRLAARADPDALERIGFELLGRQARHERAQGVGVHAESLDEDQNVEPAEWLRRDEERCEFEYGDLAKHQKRREELIDTLAPRCSETFQGCVLEKFGADQLPATAREAERQVLARVMSDARVMGVEPAQATTGEAMESRPRSEPLGGGAPAPGARDPRSAARKVSGARRM